MSVKNKNEYTRRLLDCFNLVGTFFAVTLSSGVSVSSRIAHGDEYNHQVDGRKNQFVFALTMTVIKL